MYMFHNFQVHSYVRLFQDCVYLLPFPGSAGRLFYEYHRVYDQTRRLNGDHPLWFMHENVVRMEEEVKQTMSRFLMVRVGLLIAL